MVVGGLCTWLVQIWSQTNRTVDSMYPITGYFADIVRWIALLLAREMNLIPLWTWKPSGRLTVGQPLNLLTVHTHQNWLHRIQLNAVVFWTPVRQNGGYAAPSRIKVGVNWSATHSPFARNVWTPIWSASLVCDKGKSSTTKYLASLRKQFNRLSWC